MSNELNAAVERLRAAMTDGLANHEGEVEDAWERGERGDLLDAPETAVLCADLRTVLDALSGYEGGASQSQPCGDGERPAPTEAEPSAEGRLCTECHYFRGPLGCKRYPLSTLRDARKQCGGNEWSPR